MFDRDVENCLRVMGNYAPVIISLLNRCHTAPVRCGFARTECHIPGRYLFLLINLSDAVILNGGMSIAKTYLLINNFNVYYYRKIADFI